MNKEENVRKEENMIDAQDVKEAIDALIEDAWIQTNDQAREKFHQMFAGKKPSSEEFIEYVIKDVEARVKAEEAKVAENNLS